jgi:cytochrome c553
MRRVQSVCLRVAALGAAAGAMMMSSLPTRCDELSPAAQRGLTIMRTNCARCHSIDKVSESPLRIAPPFRTLHQRYPLSSKPKCNTPADLIIGTVDQDLRECCHAMLFAFVG